MTTQATKPKPEVSAQEDEFLWLEDRDSERAREWVREQNARTLAELQGDPDYQPIFDTALRLMTAEDNLASGAEIRGKVYNFWQDAKNALGIWRRTTVESYKTNRPNWETIIDFDALAAKEGVRWVFNGATRLYPDFSRSLLSMSPDGGDAAELREFDIETKTFIENGFRAPASKSSFAWLDIDTVLVSAAFEDEEKTDSGYPRVVKLWKRGEPLAQARQIFDIDKHELLAAAGVEHEDDKTYVFLNRMIDFYAAKGFLWTPDGKIRHVPLPDDSTSGYLFKAQYIFGVRTPWTAPDGTACVPDAL